MNTKEDFLKLWENLSTATNNLIKMTETNRRLISGLSVLLIEKGVITSDEIKKLEEDVVAALVKKKKRRRRRGKEIK